MVSCPLTLTQEARQMGTGFLFFRRRLKPLVQPVLVSTNPNIPGCTSLSGALEETANLGARRFRGKP